MKVTFEKSILYYDCELLFEAADETGQSYIAIHDEDRQSACEYIVLPVSPEDLADFNARKVGLKHLMLVSPGGQWFTTRLGVDSEGIILKPETEPITEQEAFLEPDFYLWWDNSSNAADSTETGSERS